SFHDGLFHLYATLRLNNPPEGIPGGPGTAWPLRRQLYTCAERPEGPWSRPVFLEVDNIDPSLFVDGEGSRWMAIAPGLTLVPLTSDGKAVAGEAFQAWAGTGRPCAEGPRLLLKDGWYYAFLAEGGTGFGHCVTVARSRKLAGPYEECPHNPILTQAEPSAPLQRCGHGSPIQTPAGDWWMLYLCGRPNGGPWTTLGRETALDPMRWTEEGWPAVNEGRGPSEIQAAPNLPSASPARRPGNGPWRDDFEAPRLRLEWEFARNPDPSSWSLSERPGFFRILTGPGGLDSIGAKNTLLRRETEHRYTASLRLEFDPPEGGGEAGLACYYGLRNHVSLALLRERGLRLRLAENRNGRKRVLGELPLDDPGGRAAVELRVEVEGQARRFLARELSDQGGWRTVGTVADSSFLSDEGVAEGKHHTGTMVGLFANAQGTPARSAADFDCFEYEGRDRP
ncbi:MAG TPA: family 43 glycosylhydrolase, partial [Spirochaetales bacterium]|nr:family 43 glycosylhydrolase [Spirochaetales bacterium]